MVITSGSSGGGNNNTAGTGGGTQLTAQTITFYGTVKTTYDYGDTGETISVSGANTTVTYSLSDRTDPSDVAEINPSTGQITINKAGSFKVKAQAAADSTYAQSEITSSVITVNKKTVTLSWAITPSGGQVGDSDKLFRRRFQQIN